MIKGLVSPGELPVKYMSRPSWMPDEMYDAVRGRKIHARFTRGEKRLYKSRKRTQPSKWILGNVRVAVGPYSPGLVRRDYSPYSVEVWDCIYMPTVRVCVLMWAAQTHKTTTFIAAIMYSYAQYPGPVMTLSPNEVFAKELVKKKYKPAIQNTPALRRLLTGRDKDITLTSIGLKHLDHYFAYAGSLASYSDRSVLILHIEEADKCETDSKNKESDLMDYAQKRILTYNKRSKIFISCTPSDEEGNINKEFKKCTKYVYKVPCPHCQMMIELDDAQVRWPKGYDGHSLYWKDILEQKLAWYVCQECKRELTNYQKDDAILRGRWFEPVTGLTMEEHIRRYKIQSIAPHLPSLYSPDVTCSMVASDFLKTVQLETHKERSEARKDYWNFHKSLPYKTVYSNIEESRLIRLKSDLSANIVPGGNVVSVLTCAIDTQDNYFVYEVRAWGWGTAFTSWQVSQGICKTFEELEPIIYARYLDPKGLVYEISLSLIDSGGNRTVSVYNFARKHVGVVLPYKSQKGRRDQPYAYKKMDTYPDGKTSIPGGLYLLKGDKHYAKDFMMQSIAEVPPGEPGSWNLNASTTKAYLKQMQNYGLNKFNMWEKSTAKAVVDFHDTGSMNVTAAEILRIHITSGGG